MTVEEDAEDRRALGTRRHEQTQPPADDLGDEPRRLQAIDHAVGEAGRLDPVDVHDGRAPHGQPVRQLQHPSYVQLNIMKSVFCSAALRTNVAISGQGSGPRR